MTVAIEAKPTESEVKAATKLRKYKKLELYAYGHHCRIVKKGDTYKLIREQLFEGGYVDRELIPVLPFREFHLKLAAFDPLSLHS